MATEEKRIPLTCAVRLNSASTSGSLSLLSKVGRLPRPPMSISRPSQPISLARVMAPSFWRFNIIQSQTEMGKGVEPAPSTAWAVSLPGQIPFSISFILSLAGSILTYLMRWRLQV